LFDENVKFDKSKCFWSSRFTINDSFIAESILIDVTIHLFRLRSRMQVANIWRGKLDVDPPFDDQPATAGRFRARLLEYRRPSWLQDQAGTQTVRISGETAGWISEQKARRQDPPFTELSFWLGKGLVQWYRFPELTTISSVAGERPPAPSCPLAIQTYRFPHFVRSLLRKQIVSYKIRFGINEHSES